MVKTFEDLVIEFDVPIRDRRKYNSLMNGIYLRWFDVSKTVDENLFDKIVSELVRKKKVSKYAYTMLRSSQEHSCEKKVCKWNETLEVDNEMVNWSSLH